MTTMSVGVALQLLASQIPFLVERDHMGLPFIQEDTIPEPINDVWTALALLVKRHNDRTVRRVMTRGCGQNLNDIAIVRVSIYSSGYTREEFTCNYDFPLTNEVVNKLINERYVEGTPRWGHTDSSELQLSDLGKKALLDHINQLPE